MNLKAVLGDLSALSLNDKSTVYQTMDRLVIPVPKVRKSLKTITNKFSAASNTVDFWDEVWNKSNLYEAKSLALYRFQSGKLTSDEFEKLRHWVHQCYCWEHSDDLSKIFAEIVEKDPELILPSILEWNKSDNFWLRRISIVSLIEYASKRSRFLPASVILELIDNLLLDPEYYVQKAIGWTLREMYAAYPENTTKYIKHNLVNLTPIAFNSAIAKFDKEQKARFKKIRAAHRKSNQN